MEAFPRETQQNTQRPLCPPLQAPPEGISSTRQIPSQISSQPLGHGSLDSSPSKCFQSLLNILKALAFPLLRLLILLCMLQLLSLGLIPYLSPLKAEISLISTFLTGRVQGVWLRSSMKTR